MKKADSIHLKTFIEHFIETAERYPHHIALAGGKQICYQQLLEHCLNIAQHLHQHLNDAQHVPIIAIYLPASAPLFQAILSTWLANSAFSLFYTDQSLTEVRRRLLNVKPSLLITTSDLLPKLNEGQSIRFQHGKSTISLDAQTLPVLDFEYFLAHPIAHRLHTHIPLPDFNQLAYVAHTSGTSKDAKGIAIAHRGLLNACQTHIDVMQLTPNERILQFAAVNFDAIFMEMMLALGTGSTLVLDDLSNRYKVSQLAEPIQRHRITTMIFTPQLLREFEPEDFPSLNNLILTGENVPKDLIDKWYSAGKHAFNGYGLVETTIALTLCPYDGENASMGGQPMRGLRYWLMPEHGNTPIDVGQGEMVVAGTGLMLGQFVNGSIIPLDTTMPDPDAPDQTITCLRTGDWIERTRSGALLFQCRLDHQVEIAGERVEPDGVAESIQSILNDTTDFQTRCVHVDTATNQYQHTRLIAFLQFNRTITAEEYPRLLTLLAGDHPTPSAAVPRHYYLLDPAEKYLTENGKRNRQKIMADMANYPKLSLPVLHSPNTKTEERMLAIWKTVFDEDAIDVVSTFEALGGFSLLFVRLRLAIEQDFGVDPMMANMPIPFSIRTLSRHIDLLCHANDALESLNEAAPERPVVLCCAPLDGSVQAYRNLANDPTLGSDFQWINVRPPNQAIGLQSLEQFAQYLAPVVQKRMRNHSVSLLGWSYGGICAYAIGSALSQLGVTIAQCAIVDTPAPSSIHQLSPERYLGSIEHLLRTTVTGFGCQQLLQLDQWQPNLSKAENQSVPEQTDQLIDSLLSRFPTTQQHPDQEACYQVLSGYRQNMRFAIDYQPSTCTFPLTLYTAQKPSLIDAHFQVEVSAWQKLATHAPCQVHHFDHDHFEIIQSDAFKDQLRQDLDQHILMTNLSQVRHRVWEHLRHGQFQQALHQANLLLSQDSYDAEDYALRARVLAEMNRYHYAMADIKTALQLNPECIIALITQALIWQVRATNPFDALEPLDAALKRIESQNGTHPDHAFALRMKGEILLGVPTHFVAGLACFKKALEMEPHNAALYAGLGKRLIDLDQYTLAQPYLTKACQLAPKEEYYQALLRVVSEKTKRLATQTTPKSTTVLDTVSNFFTRLQKKDPGALLKACRSGDLGLMQQLVQSGHSIDITDPITGRSLLHWACIKGHPHVVQWCLEQALPIMAYDQAGETPVHLAAQHGHYDILHHIQQHVSATTWQQCCDLATLAPADGKRFVHFAAQHSNAQVIQFCLAMGANPNSVTRFHFTPLHFAGQHDTTHRVVQCLIEVHHADPNQVNTLGFDAFEWAIRRGAIQSAIHMLPAYEKPINLYRLAVWSHPDMRLLHQADDAARDQTTLDGYFPCDLGRAQSLYAYLQQQHEHSDSPSLWVLATYELAMLYQRRAQADTTNEADSALYRALAQRNLEALSKRLDKDHALELAQLSAVQEVLNGKTDTLQHPFIELVRELNQRINRLEPCQLNDETALNYWDCLGCLAEQPEVKDTLLASYRLLLEHDLTTAEQSIKRLLKHVQSAPTSLTTTLTTILSLDLLRQLSIQRKDPTTALKLLMSVRSLLLQSHHTLHAVLNTEAVLRQIDAQMLDLIDRANPTSTRSAIHTVRNTLRDSRHALAVYLCDQGNSAPSEASPSSALRGAIEIDEASNGTKNPAQKVVDQKAKQPLSINKFEHFNILRDHELLADDAALQQAIRTHQQHYCTSFQRLFQEALVLQGEAPCAYSVCVAGSLANGLPCLFSDVEWFILIENDTKANVDFFNSVSQRVSQLMIGVGETPFACLPNGQSTTRRGFSEDPSGLTPSNQHGYHLISTPKKLAQTLLGYQEYPVELINTLLHTLWLCGEQTLYDQFAHARAQQLSSLSQQWPLKERIIEQQITGYLQEFALRLDPVRELQEQSFTVKRDLFRLIVLFIQALAVCSTITTPSLSDTLRQLVQKGMLSDQGAKEILTALLLSYVLRNKAQHHYGEEFEFIQYEPDVISDCPIDNPYQIEELDRQRLNRIYRTIIPVHFALEQVQELLKNRQRLTFVKNAFLGDDIRIIAQALASDMAHFDTHSKAEHYLRWYRAINPYDIDGLEQSYTMHLHKEHYDEAISCALRVYRRTTAQDTRHAKALVSLGLLYLRKGFENQELLNYDLCYAYLLSFFDLSLSPEKETTSYLLAYLYLSDYFLATGKAQQGIKTLHHAQSHLDQHKLPCLSLGSIGVDTPAGNVEKTQSGNLFQTNVVNVMPDLLPTQHWRAYIKVLLRMSEAYLSNTQAEKALKVIEKAFQHFDKIIENGVNANHDLYHLCLKQKAKVYQALQNYEKMYVTLYQALWNQSIVMNDYLNHLLVDAMLFLFTECMQVPCLIHHIPHQIDQFIRFYNPEDRDYYKKIVNSVDGTEHVDYFRAHRTQSLFTLLTQSSDFLARVDQQCLAGALRQKTLDQIAGQGCTAATLLEFCLHNLSIVYYFTIEPAEGLSPEMEEKFPEFLRSMQQLCQRIIERFSPLIDHEGLTLIAKIADINELLSQEALQDHKPEFRHV